MTQPCADLLVLNGVSQGQISLSTDKLNLDVTVTELRFIEDALVGRVDKNIEMLPLLNRVRYLLSMPPFLISSGSPLVRDR
jgi:hypothetical protein